MFRTDPLRILRNVAKLTVFRGWNKEEDLKEFNANIKLNPKMGLYKIPITNNGGINVLNVIIHLNPGDFPVEQITNFIHDERSQGKLLLIVYDKNCGTTKYKSLRKQYENVWFQCIEADLLKLFVPDHILMSDFSLIKESQPEYKLFLNDDNTYNSFHITVLPTISIYDPMTLYLDGRINDIVAIRSSNSICYRRVVDVEIIN